MITIETRKGTVEIRELHSIKEMEAAEKLQNRVWGVNTSPTPKENLVAVQFEGGLLAGAFTTSGEMIGLIFSFPTRDPEIQHSHLLAVLEEWRGQGIGTRLKWFQRAWSLERGIRRVRWTVDPLRATNAVVNIYHLGGVADVYLPDYYGPMQGIDAGVPTDRLLLEWFLLDRRVEERANGLSADRGFPDASIALTLEHNLCPTDPLFGLDADRILIPLPPNYIRLCRSNPEIALDWRLKTRELFLHYFGRGYQISGFTQVGGPAYLLERKVENEP